MNEIIEEGLAATRYTLQAYAASWLALSQIADEIQEVGHYVPMLLPPPEQTVLLIVLRDANAMTAKSLHSNPPEMMIALAQHTGQSIRDEAEGYYADYWRTSPGAIHLIDCAKEAVYWLPLPTLWQPTKYVGWGTPLQGVTTNKPVFKHLCIHTQRPELTPELADPIYLKTHHQWTTEEAPSVH